MKRPPSLQSRLDEYAAGFDTKDTENLAGITAACPHCDAVVGFLIAETGSLKGEIGPSTWAHRHLFQLVCPVCRRLVLVATMYGQCPEAGKRTLELRVLWPMASVPNFAPADVEPEVQRDYDEARSTLRSSSTASAAMSRRCLQHIIRRRLNFTRKTLHQEIQEALKDDRLSKSARDAIDHVREFGNLAAHPELDAAQTLIDVGPGEAEYCLRVIEMLFEDLYEAPVRTAQMKALLTAKRGSPAVAGGGAAQNT